VQSDVLSVLATRVVVPLYRKEIGHSKDLTRLTPVVKVGNQSLIAVVPEWAGIHRRELEARVGDLSAVRNDLLQAIDLLLTGF